MLAKCSYVLQSAVKILIAVFKINLIKQLRLVIPLEGSPMQQQSLLLDTRLGQFDQRTAREEVPRAQHSHKKLPS